MKKSAPIQSPSEGRNTRKQGHMAEAARTSTAAAESGVPETGHPREGDSLALIPARPGSVAPLTRALDDDAASGLALTEQYHRAVGGMREVLRFGVMMMQLRDKLSTRGQLKAGRPNQGETDHIAPWLAEHAPDIKRSTAYRFLHVAEAVASEFQTPAKVSFIDLVTAATADLPEKLQLKQAELWEFVDGTSQKSWLDRFAPPKKREYHPPKPKSDDGLPEEAPSGWLPHLWARYRTLQPEQRTAWDILYIPAFKVFAEFEETFPYLPDQERDELDGWLLDMRNKIRAAKQSRK